LSSTYTEGHRPVTVTTTLTAAGQRRTPTKGKKTLGWGGKATTVGDNAAPKKKRESINSNEDIEIKTMCVQSTGDHALCNPLVTQSEQHRRRSVEVERFACDLEQHDNV
jgi:hypothetical protein